MGMATVCGIASLIVVSSQSKCVAMAKASEVLPGADPDSSVKEIKLWLKSKGVRDFEPVSLFCDQLTKVRIITMLCLILST